jgi:hypothetical protein
MPHNPPMLITRVHVGKGPGIVLISLASPSGELGQGPVENIETVRIAMTHATFREVAELFSHTAAEIEASDAGPQVGAGRAPLHVMGGKLKN